MSNSSRRLTHLDSKGRAKMVDVGGKAATSREARAEAFVRMEPATLRRVLDGTTPKGDVLAVARIAGIMAAKKTHELIPLCHALQLTLVGVEVAAAGESRLRIETTARCRGQTGVEMEALTAASIAALTVYDMLKAVERGIEIENVRLLEKSGGKSGHWKKNGKRS